MAIDGFLYLILSPIGLLILLALVGIPLLIWYAGLDQTHDKIGNKPFVVGYLFSIVGIVIACFMDAHAAFYTGNAGKHNLPSAYYWRSVSESFFYNFILIAIPSLIILGICGVPLSIKLIRNNRFNYKNIILYLTSFWIAASVIACIILSNPWAEQHRIESLVKTLKDLFPWVAFVGGFFFGGMALAINQRSRVAQKIS